MVLRDRNHPSVLFWSAGNESGEGENICAVIDEGRKFDKTRYWMYGGNAFSHRCEEIIGPRYPQIRDLLTRVYNVPPSEDPRPSFLDEYLAVTGNGGGGLDDYWDLFLTHSRSMGGAIWDFVSTGITEKARYLKDGSGNDIQVNVMGRAKLVAGRQGKGIDLNGHDQWVEVYRDEKLDISGDRLTLTLWVYPRSLSSSAGTLITKGDWQFGIHQTGADSLEFYVTTRSRQNVRIALPADWEYNWHHVTAVYDGSSIFLTIDEKESRHRQVSGNIRDTPYPVNIGRNAEIHGQETSVYISDAVIDQAGIFDRVISAGLLKEPSEGLRQLALLWLDFEEETFGDDYFSYGIGARTYGSIWPDRRPQPEMWQIKKSAQPVHVEPVSLQNGLVGFSNRYLFTDLSELDTRWALQENGKIIQEGKLDTSVPPGGRSVFKIPFRKPDLKPGSEYFLTLSFHLKGKTLWADSGFEIAWDQMKMPWSVCEDQPGPLVAPPVKVTGSNDRLFVSGNDFNYSFDKNTGYLISMSVNGHELINKGPELNIWRAPLANETDSWTFWSSNIKNRIDGFGHMAATEWYSSGIDRLSMMNDKVSWETKGDSLVSVRVRNVYSTGNQRGSFISDSEFIVDGNGLITYINSVIPNGQMPAWLPRTGQQWILSSSLGNVMWFGRGPQENYPDRKSGYRTGEYRSTVSEMYEPYLIPQDYGLRTDTRYVRMTGENGHGLEFSSDKLFNFSAHPYSTENLTRAVYTYQLHRSEGITFNLDYATSGVGCTAAGVFPEYQVMPQRFDFTLRIRPIIP
jgi:beta-galactosidase